MYESLLIIQLTIIITSISRDFEEEIYFYVEIKNNENENQNGKWYIYRKINDNEILCGNKRKEYDTDSYIFIKLENISEIYKERININNNMKNKYKKKDSNPNELQNKSLDEIENQKKLQNIFSLLTIINKH